LLNQIKRCRLDGGCVYRGENGMKCAAGILIPDDQYNPKMEGLFWETLVSRNLVEDKFPKEIGELQVIHDSNHQESIEFLKTKLAEFAQKHGLQVNFEV